MSEPVENLSAIMDDVPVPDVSQLITEDDTPVDNMFSEKQMRLLTEPLYSAWEGPPEGRPFLAAANVGVFATATNNPLVPDVFLSLDTSSRRPLSVKRNRSYFIWEHGKPPDIVIEVVSNKEGGELDRKVRAYERMRVVHYVVFDPFEMLSNVLLMRFELLGGQLVQQKGNLWVPAAGLGLTLWRGPYEGDTEQWLRWCRKDGSVVSTGAERADAEKQRADASDQRADAEKQRADAAKQQAEAEKQRAERLAARLRELGVDPEA